VDIHLGESGLDKTFQRDFPKTVRCHKCGGVARIMFVAIEGPKEGKYICQLHDNRKGEYWPHDACAVAVYLCGTCFEPTALMNQA